MQLNQQTFSIMEMINSNSETKKTIKVNFRLSSRKLPYSYISSIPKGLNLVSISESRKSKIKGFSNGFTFYYNSYNYISAEFNINDFVKIEHGEFLYRIETMFSTLHYLNDRPATSLEVYLILKHIRKQSRYVFSIRDMYCLVRKFKYSKSLVEIKKKDYDQCASKRFKKPIYFTNALTSARKTVEGDNNLKDLFYFFEKCINNNDYECLHDSIFNRYEDNNLIMYACVREFNFLGTSLQRIERELVNGKPLYKKEVKRFSLKSNMLEPQENIVFMEEAIKKSKRKLKLLERLVENRVMVHQMFLILKELTGSDTDLKFLKNVKLQKQLKSDLMNIINRTENKNILAGAKEFDRNYRKPVNSSLPLNSNLSGTFDKDLKNSVFNQVDIEIAQSKGDMFFGEFMRFHKKEEVTGMMNFGLILPI
jgi:hypothetical protein